MEKQKYRQIFRCYYPQLLVYAKSIVGDIDSEDIVEDVFMYIWNHPKVYMSDDANIRSYLYRSVYTRSLNVLRARTISSEYIGYIDDINDMRMNFIVSTERNAQQILENDDLRRRIEGAIEKLPEKRRHVFILSYIKGLSNKEISDMLEISVRTVETHLFKALRFLREELKDILSLLLIFVLFLFLK